MAEQISLRPRVDHSLGLGGGNQGRGLPVDLLEDISRRLRFTCVMLIVVAAARVVLDRLTAPEARAANSIALIAISLVVHWLARPGRLSSARLLNLGTGYEIIVAAAASLAVVPFAWTVGSLAVWRWSGIAVWVLIFPIIVPNTPRRVFLGSIAAAATEPLIAALFIATGSLAPLDVSTFIQLTWPNVVAVGLAVFVSRIVYNLGEELSEARSLGSYHLVGLLGRGGMGEVWKATHRLLARPAAVKLIQREHLGEASPAEAEDIFRRFEREAQATAALCSPHTIQLYDFGLARDGTFYYVMELLDGEDLDTLVRQHEVQPPERVVGILRQACHSLHEAHRRGLVHRDIKPANIFLCRYGADLDFVKVLDFGLVKEHLAAAGTEAGQMASGGLSGTPAFMAPEALTGEGTVDGRADLYGLGCVAYWLLTGRLVFERATIMALVAAHVQQRPEPVGDRAPQPVPEGLTEIVMSCLAKKPTDRPESAMALSNALGALNLEEAWTEERAAAWWTDYQDRRVAREDAEVEARSLETTMRLDR
jgi:serine/threonine-protein kinase